MPFVRAGQLARPTPTARPDDPLGLVAENLRASHYGTIPVLDRVVIEDPALITATPEARVLGLIDERDLARVALPVLERQEAVRVAAVTPWSAAPPIPAVAPELNGNGAAHRVGPAQSAAAELPDPDAQEAARVAQLTANAVMRVDIGFVPASFTLHNALLTLDRYETSALPVIDGAGGYRGMISRADVVAALGHNVRPPVVGGMATPLGVWLTTGTLSAGAGPLGIFLSGFVLGLCYTVAYLVMLLGLAAYDRNLAALFYSGRIGMVSASGTAPSFILALAQFLLFAGFLRLLPMAGIHAAEHQTVWAMEKGLPLVPEVVGQMPRVHPRCGTNLVVLAGLIAIVMQHLPEINGFTTVGSMVFIYFTWRSFGGAVQQYLTTRPATRRQLESGIKAGRALLEKYQNEPHADLSLSRRLFNSSLLLCAAGLMVVQCALYIALPLLAERLLP